MRIRNSDTQWGLMSILFHWVSALFVIGLFVLGYWMVGLDYYSDWYRLAPDWHRSVGVLLIAFIMLRLLWRIYTVTPLPIETHRPWEKTVSKYIHGIFYGLLLLMLPTGYFITTADGQSLYVFDWFSLPATVTHIENLEDIAGDVHEFIAYSIIVFVVVHMLGALKHHIVDKDRTLLRMLGR